MVAYSFQRQFIEPIRLGIRDPKAAGAKLQTIRAHRKRHARAGEMLQLYSGMRTKNCMKIVPDQLCEDVFNIRFEVAKSGIKDIYFGLSEPRFELPKVNEFAQEDGFFDADAMRDFWLSSHGEGLFEGVLVKWFPEAVQLQ
ncbi:MAG: hypothetical protein ACJAVZ_000109 [Afipia broomeae]|jgi:hypothetical protein